MTVKMPKSTVCLSVGKWSLTALLNCRRHQEYRKETLGASNHN